MRYFGNIFAVASLIVTLGGFQESAIANSPHTVLNNCTKYGGRYHEDKNFKICHIMDGQKLLYTLKLNKHTGKLSVIYPAPRSANDCPVVAVTPNGVHRQCRG